MDFSLVIPAFIAGVLMFLAPCTLPLVPGFLGFISGVSLRDVEDPTKTRSARRKIFLNGLAFIAGWTTGLPYAICGGYGYTSLNTDCTFGSSTNPGSSFVSN